MSGLFGAQVIQACLEKIKGTTSRTRQIHEICRINYIGWGIKAQRMHQTFAN